jgi:parallel beta-helix repeat protein
LKNALLLAFLLACVPLRAELAFESDAPVTITSDIEAGRVELFKGTGSVSFLGNTRLWRVYPEWWGAKADGVTDSTDAIEKSIVAAATCNAMVSLGAGAYRFSKQIDLLSYSRIVGQGEGKSILLQADNANLLTLVRNSGNSYVTLKDFTLDGNKANNGPFWYGIYETGATNCRVENVEVKNLDGDGDTSAGGIDFGGGGNADNTIQDCNLHDLGTNAGDKSDGIYAKGDRFKIVNNTVKSSDTGIVYEAASTDPTNPNSGVVITGNIIEQNVGAAIAFSARSASGVTPVHLSGATIANNTIRGGVAANGGSIFLYADLAGNTLANVTVMGNLLLGITHATAIHAERLTDSAITGNVMNGVSVNSTKHGIALLSCASVNVTGNVLRAVGGYGVTVQGSTDCALSANTITDCGKAGSGNPAGIDIRSRTVGGVTFASTGIQVVGNTVTGNVTPQTSGNNYGVLISGASTVQLVGNTVKGNLNNYSNASTGEVRRAGNVMSDTPGAASFSDNLSVKGTFYLDSLLLFDQGVSGAPSLQSSGGRLKLRGGPDGLQVGLSPLEKLAFYGGSPVTRPVITGSYADGTVLASVVAALAAMGLAVNETTP